jgi:hypothetical protein
VDVKTSKQELRNFDMLRVDTIHHITGAFDKGFWAVDVLRATRESAAIWHAGLALAAMHRRMTLPTTKCAAAEEHYMFALKQYNSAIRHLVSITKQPKLTLADRETLLLAAVLFTGIACLQGNPREAIVHARNGLQLFYQWRYWEQLDVAPSSRVDSIIRAESIIALVNNLESQFTKRLGHVAPPLRPEGARAHRCSPEPFASATAAYFELLTLMNGLLKSWRSTEQPTALRNQAPEMYLAYRHELSVWKKKLRTFQQTHKPGPSDWESHRILELLSLGLDMGDDVNLTESVLMYDRHADKFEQIMQLIRELSLEKCHSIKTKRIALPLFSFSISICEFLSWFCTSCRDRRLRREAIETLATWELRDGLWDSALVAAINEAFMKVEEDGILEGNLTAADGCKCVPDGFICHSHRVLQHWVEFLDDGAAKLFVLTANDVKQGREPRVILLDPEFFPQGHDPLLRRCRS